MFFIKYTMLKLFFIFMLFYVLTIALVVWILHKEDPELNWKEAIVESFEVPVVFVPIVNTCVVIVYLFMDFVDRFKLNR